ncbi:energy transducer TonB [Mucilaginibacter myungsuensis]|uniref:TonB family protein n=1 Tax=Mucilaginibacter myungsuensis TaxID=649104 RepID=A0A929PYR9_9SPHI|nr:energy transducer TonB [Mucilaginibacter myungsuensis]MBE9664566.1 TonB family protein [Mucilaginibacter myungsuensis]MDN3601084.1 energy transducer TonB [Mucilaginibacter myungsuensis]
MKYNLLLIFIMILGKNGLAQKKFITVLQDTIHLRGIVYNNDSAPAPNVLLLSRNRNLDGLELFTRSDKDGRFQLKGARWQDSILVIGVQNGTWVYNKGSRFISITLPAEQPKNINEGEPILITSSKIGDRKKFPVKYEISNEACFDCGPGIYKHDSEYPGGIDKLIEFIKHSVSYPEKAANNGIEGGVEIEFEIAKDGSPQNFKIVKGTGYGCEDRVIAAIKRAKKWKPGILNGRYLKTTKLVAFEFKLVGK